MGSDERVGSPAFERNKDPILGVLQPLWGQGRPRILEVASGPGQHAVYYASLLPKTCWQPTDASERLCRSVDAWVAHEGVGAQVSPALRLDVREDAAWPQGSFEGALAINFLHMVDLATVETMLRGAARSLVAGGHLVVYDCFTYGSVHVSPSNEAFDLWLKRETEGGGVHEFDEVDRIACSFGFKSGAVHRLPSNNQCVVWESSEVVER